MLVTLYVYLLKNINFQIILKYLYVLINKNNYKCKNKFKNNIKSNTLLNKLNKLVINQCLKVFVLVKI